MVLEREENVNEPTGVSLTNRVINIPFRDLYTVYEVWTHPTSLCVQVGKFLWRELASQSQCNCGRGRRCLTSN